ncbi:ribonuclease H1 domain-containing protein [Portibacter lacus]|uniref:Ribonuclease H n=1 Tax=Portibacter lacus TaxID=1099794 RepID=A0AA37SLH7_9BACT|nr:ribonuclease H family protein [Portibacter lacus]GLR16658.1 ribonuclease H [Portibacter lacus]
MAKKKKYYVVWQGHEPGIYESWNACQQQIKGYPAAKYKSFSTESEAKNAFHGNYHDHITKAKKKSPSFGSRDAILKNTWSVDAACSGNPGLMEYRGVETDTGIQLFHQGPFKKGTNNIGEFLAIVHALALLQKTGDHNRIIYTDSRTAMAWVRNKKVKTMLKREPVNEILFDLIDRAVNWLKNNKYQNKIVKWETKEWGEIPADFGRK